MKSGAELGISRRMLYRLLAKHELRTYTRHAYQDASVDLDEAVALHGFRQQFRPRKPRTEP